MESADLIVDLSPPRPNQEVSSDLSPSSYIHHEAMLEPLRRKASLQIGPKMHKRCRLEPAPIATGQTIMKYYNRVHESVSKETLSVRIPGQEMVKLLNDGQEWKEAYAAVREEIKYLKGDHAGKISKLQGRINELETESEKLQAETKELQAESKTIKARIERQDNARFKMFHANILVDFVKKVFVELSLKYPGNLEEVKDTKKTRYAQAARSLSPRQLEAFVGGENGKKLGPQYHKVLQGISDYIGDRNETAHESHVEFAELLYSEPYRFKKDYWKWANLLPRNYGKSVEEIVKDQEAAAQKKEVGEEVWEPADWAGQEG